MDESRTMTPSAAAPAKSAIFASASERIYTCLREETAEGGGERGSSDRGGERSDLTIERKNMMDDEFKAGRYGVV